MRDEIYESNGLRCPLMGSELCMGMDCACAVYDESTDMTQYSCGLVTLGGVDYMYRKVTATKKYGRDNRWER